MSVVDYNTGIAWEKYQAKTGTYFLYLLRSQPNPISYSAAVKDPRAVKSMAKQIFSKLKRPKGQ